MSTYQRDGKGHTSPDRDCGCDILISATRGTVSEAVRKFESGATRDTDTDKFDYEAFLSPLVVRRYGEFMHKNRTQRDGTLRDGDNWQRQIPFSSYMKSAWRHFVCWWSWHRGHKDAQEGLEDALCALLFNVSGYLHEVLKTKHQGSGKVTLVGPDGSKVQVNAADPEGK